MDVYRKEAGSIPAYRLKVASMGVSHLLAVFDSRVLKKTRTGVAHGVQAVCHGFSPSGEASPPADSKGEGHFFSAREGAVSGRAREAMKGCIRQGETD